MEAKLRLPSGKEGPLRPRFMFTGVTAGTGKKQDYVVADVKILTVQ